MVMSLWPRYLAHPVDPSLRSYQVGCHVFQLSRTSRKWKTSSCRGTWKLLARSFSIRNHSTEIRSDATRPSDTRFDCVPNSTPARTKRRIRAVSALPRSGSRTTCSRGDLSSAHAETSTAILNQVTLHSDCLYTG